MDDHAPNWWMRHAAVSRILAVLVTVVLVFGALSFNRETDAVAPAVVEGKPSPLTFVSPEDHSEVDQEATEAARNLARINTEPSFTTNPAVKLNVNNELAAFFAAVREAAEPVPADSEAATFGIDPEATTTTTSSSTTTTSTTTTSAPPEGEEEPVEETTTTSSSTTTTTLMVRPSIPWQIEQLSEQYPATSVTTIETFVTVFNEDIVRISQGGEGVFNDIETEAIELAARHLDEGIKATEMSTVRNNLFTLPSDVFVPGLPADQRPDVDNAVVRLVADTIEPNEEEDEAETERQREANAAAVEEITESWVANETIVEQGEVVTKLQAQAIEDLGLIEPPQTTNFAGIFAVGALAVVLTAFFVLRIAPARLIRPKHFVLLGVLLVLAAATARLPEFVVETGVELGYLVPAATFGFLASILYDARTAVLLAIPMAIFTAVTTGDAGFTIYAAAATIVPVPFVSSVSSRRDLRLGVALGALALAPFAAGVAWFFHGADIALLAGGFGFIGGIAAGIIAQGLLPFFENLFRVTTTLTLLDLTDRNHPALRHIEERAPGTFNHSILVGTLAGKAARAIGANALLAQAAAYYHDLGKTVEPGYFIENQFGVSNPHDEMSPEESAKVIRAHVTDGLKLAKQYRIPPDVAEGILTHHGEGIMRYFYHKGLAADPGTDPELYRHHGQKPRRREMAIIMLSDAVEGAARALAQHEDPTPDSLRKLVDTVVGEKVDDGQLDSSDLTMADLTTVKAALVDALVGYYHTRITYPGFPGRE